MTSSEINAQIFNLAPEFFEAVREEVRSRATHAATHGEKKANQLKLEAAITEVMNEAIPQEIDHAQLWQVLWQRITFAGTRASKATREIESMRRLVPLFRDLASYDPSRYLFDKQEWMLFAERWRARFTSPAQKSNWLALSKDEPDWDPARDFANCKTTSDVWKILIKDKETFPGLKFSALPSKVEKYLAVAQFLHQHKATGSNPLDHYMGVAKFSPLYLEGDDWVKERQMLATVRERFAAQVGPLTALHTMMDLGLKTIKPDRVMTYLFSQLGWLQTLPASLSKDDVIDNYLRPDVIEEMTIRSDIFAASLDQAKHKQAHRLLDIWLVKFGQEPEPDWGITANLQDGSRGIREVLEDIKTSANPTSSWITATDANVRWPSQEYLPVSIKRLAGSGTGKVKLSKRRSPILMTRDEAGKLFRSQWIAGRAAHPDIYPDRTPGIPNEQKELILRKIERGVNPEDAFLWVLNPDGDD